MRKKLRVTTVIILTVLLIFCFNSIYFFYEASARNAIRELDLSNEIVFSIFIILSLLFNISKILPIKYYRKKVHLILRSIDLLVITLTSIYFSLGIFQFFKKTATKGVHLKDILFLSIIFLILGACVYLFQDNLLYHKEVQKRKEIETNTFINEIGT